MDTDPLRTTHADPESSRSTVLRDWIRPAPTWDRQRAALTLLILCGIAAAVLPISTASAERSGSPLARARLALGSSLAAFEAHDTAVRRDLNRCAVMSCVYTALRKYEKYVASMQKNVKALRPVETSRQCRRSLDPLETQIVRIGIAPRVAIMAGVNDPTLALKARNAWVSAVDFFTAARRKTRAACSGM